MMTDNTPSPYYFLHRIKKIIRNKDFEIFLDLGCGSGRVIDFYNKNLLNKNFVGIEYFDEQVSHCKKNFAQHENIQIIQADFTKFNFLQLVMNDELVLFKREENNIIDDMDDRNFIKYMFEY